MEQKVTIHINGCTVTCPADQEQLYREVLADKWIDGCRVYVENGEVKNLMSDKIIKEDSLPLDVSFEIISESIRKQAALYGEL